MKVELSNPVATQGILDRAGSKVVNSNVSSSSVAHDRTTFNSKAPSVQSLVKQALRAPEIRDNRVEALKNSIASGEYKVDANKIAGAIISEGGKQ